MDSKIIAVYGIDHSVREVIPEICPGVVLYEDRKDVHRPTRTMWEGYEIQRKLDCHVIIVLINNKYFLSERQGLGKAYSSADVIIEQASVSEFKVLKNACGPLPQEQLSSLEVCSFLSEILSR